MQETPPMLRRQLQPLPRAGLFFALVGLMACAAVADETPRREFRRVDLGNGVWRVEVVPESDPPKVASAEEHRAEQSRPLNTNLQVAQWMLAEAHQCLKNGDLTRAGQLMTWVSSLELQSDRQRSAIAHQLSDLQAWKSQLEFAAASSRSSLNLQLLPNLSDLQVDAGQTTAGNQGTDHAGPQNPLGSPSNALRQPRSGMTTPPVSADVEDAGGVEKGTTDHGRAAELGTGEHDSSEGDKAAPETPVRRKREHDAAPASLPQSPRHSDQPPLSTTTASASKREIASGWPTASGREARALPGNSELDVSLLLAAFCLFLMTALLAFLLNRRTTFLDPAALRIAIEQATRQPLDPPTAGALRVFPRPAEFEAERNGASAQTDRASLPPDTANAVDHGTFPDTFAERKKKAELQRHQTERAMLQQIIARNVSLRKKSGDKQAA